MTASKSITHRTWPLVRIHWFNALRFAPFRREVRRAFVRRQRRAVNPQPARVGALDQLPMGGDEILDGGLCGADSLIPSITTTCVTPGCASTSRSKAREGVDAALPPKPPGAFPSVRTRLPAMATFITAKRRARAAREVVRPPVVGVGRRPRAVGDRIAERGDGAGTARAATSTRDSRNHERVMTPPSMTVSPT